MNGNEKEGCFREAPERGDWGNVDNRYKIPTVSSDNTQECVK